LFINEDKFYIDNLIQITRMGKSVIIASAKGGVGKTNSIINLGVALAKEGKSVALIDGSLTTPDVSLHLGIPFHVRGLAHILKDKAPIESATFHHKSGMRVIPGNVHVNMLKEFEGKQLKQLLASLKKEHDIVLVDCSAGLGKEALSAMKHCDSMVIVANPELTSIVNASKAIQTAKSMKLKTLGVVLNRMGRHRHELRENEIIPLLHKTKILGKIPEDRRVPKSIRTSDTVVHKYPRSKISKEFRSIALNLVSTKKVGKKSQSSRSKKSKQKDKKSILARINDWVLGY
jgi:septum site-determining protein MinD